MTGRLHHHRKTANGASAAMALPAPRRGVETESEYLQRKFWELDLLNGCLRQPLHLERPSSVAEVISLKFRLAAALRAEHELQDWTATETAWSHDGRRSPGPFAFSYDYQRADLHVDGPSFYDVGGPLPQATLYAASGMGAISALLLASAQLIGAAELLALPGSYGETLELIEGYARHLTLRVGPWHAGIAPARRRLLLLDSCISRQDFEAAVSSAAPDADLLLFDTTCFAGGSGRIRLVVRWARQAGLPLVLLRSHNKLDSLGAEYGRLGSAVFIAGDPRRGRLPAAVFRQLADETANVIRLLGTAALPAHFPPFIGKDAYRALTNRRVAAILRNGRHAARVLRAALPAGRVQVDFVHGLYLTLGSDHGFDEAGARDVATALSEDLGHAGYPIRHAGSFGFDFAATEWFCESSTGRYSVRIAVPDLPGALWDELARVIARWWIEHVGRRAA